MRIPITPIFLRAGWAACCRLDDLIEPAQPVRQIVHERTDEEWMNLVCPRVLAAMRQHRSVSHKFAQIELSSWQDERIQLLCLRLMLLTLQRGHQGLIRAHLGLCARLKLG